MPPGGLSTLAGQAAGNSNSNSNNNNSIFFEILIQMSFLYSYGSGKRIKLAYTRKIIDAIHSGSLLEAEYTKTEIFGLEIPTAIEGVPSEILDPANTVSHTSYCYCYYLHNSL